MKFLLGGAQLGLNYGATNQTGKPDEDRLFEILRTAETLGLSGVDTAPAYGDSEDRLARYWGANSSSHLRVDTKILPWKPDAYDAPEKWLADAERSLRRSLELFSGRVDTVYFHSTEPLQGPAGQRIWLSLATILRENAPEARLGISVYEVETAESLLNQYPLQAVQIPLNPLDQRALAGGALEKLAGQDVQITLRSLFLQGLLIAGNTASLPKKLEGHRAGLDSFLEQAERDFHGPLGACFSFLKALGAKGIITKALLGVNSAEELHQLLASFDQALPRPLEDFARLANHDPRLVDPRRW